MKRSLLATAALATALLLGGCGTWGPKLDERKDWGAEQYYNAAKSELDSGNWPAAIKLYEALESKYPFGRYAQQAQLEIAYAHYKEGETAQAITATERFMKLHPNHQNADYALYLKGLSNFKEDLGFLAKIVSQDLADRDPKAARESFEVFKELVTRFPGSRYVEDSRQRMAYLVDALARHELHVAQYYLRRGAYLAAVNRAQDVIIRFPNAPTRREALDVMVEAYDRLGMTDLRDDTRKVLAKNYPSSPLAQEGQNRTRAWWKFWN